ncbi:MAG: guanylate kinase [Ignavibacteriae bacterium]|nr:guanylate kinase [Ignavibacteriota bacterium]NOG97261.1 guanylate kinase [Ignavibacteriota bacterium]
MSLSKGKLLVFSAPSGAGKTTIVRSVLKEFPELAFSISATTRKKRETEVDGEHYFFITEAEFKKKVDNDEFVEWEKFYDYYYGTLKSHIEDLIDNGINVVLEVDVKGALNIKQVYPDSVLIFVMPPSFDTLKERLIKRNTESEEDLSKRLERVELELSYKDKFENIIVNDDLEKAKNEAKNIIKNILNGVRNGNSTN